MTRTQKSLWFDLLTQYNVATALGVAAGRMFKWKGLSFCRKEAAEISLGERKIGKYRPLLLLLVFLLLLRPSYFQGKAAAGY